MEELRNIDIFALCAAEILDELFVAFPVPAALRGSTVAAAFEPPRTDYEPRLIHPEDDDYDELFRWGFHVSMEGFELVRATDLSRFSPTYGQPFKYWTGPQRRAIEACKANVEKVNLIHRETLNFLLREGYVCEVEQPPKTYTLTSKGFAQLNKKFEGGTIRDVLRIPAARALAGGIKSAGDIAEAGSRLAQALANFLG